jgi:hypothetical protein
MRRKWRRLSSDYNVRMEGRSPGRPSALPRLLGCLLIAAGSLLASAPAYALRCARGLVTEGDVKFDVLRYCGEPYFVDAWQDPFFFGLNFGFMEDWYYNFGSNRLIRVLRFRNGRLFDIMTGDYGFGGSYSRPPLRDPRFPR